MTMIRRFLKTLQIAATAFRDNSIPGAQEQSQAEEEGLVQVEIEGPVPGAVVAGEVAQRVPASAAQVAADEMPPEDSSGSLFDFIRECYLDSLTRDLEARHPYVLLIQDNLHWIFLEAEAKKSLLNEGVTLGDDAASTLPLRTRMAELTDTYGPAMTGKTRAEAVSGQIAIERDPAQSPDVDLNFLAAWQPPGGNPI